MDVKTLVFILHCVISVVLILRWFSAILTVVFFSLSLYHTTVVSFFGRNLYLNRKQWQSSNLFAGWSVLERSAKYLWYFQLLSYTGANIPTHLCSLPFQYNTGIQWQTFWVAHDNVKLCKRCSMLMQLIVCRLNRLRCYLGDRLVWAQSTLY